MPGQAISRANGRSSVVAAMAGSACASRASRSTTSSASAARHLPRSIPGGLQVTGVSRATTTRLVTPRRLVAASGQVTNCMGFPPRVDSVVGQDEAGCRRDAFQIAAGTLRLGVAIDQLPELGVVAG